MFRDCLEWKNQNLPMNTSSDKACKLYDCALTQLANWRTDNTFGGFGSTISKMLDEDPNFIMGHIFKQGTSLIGNSEYFDVSSTEIANLKALANKLSKTLTKRELLHVEAIECLSQGNIPSACDYWEKILVDHPTDFLAINFSYFSYFYIGFKEQMRDSISRILPFWNKSIPFYDQLFGMLGFGLIQTNYWKEGEKMARKALEMEKANVWAIHALAHSKEYQNDTLAGIDLIKSTEKDWEGCDFLKVHMYWHLCLFHIENNEHDIAIDINNSKIIMSALQNNSKNDLIDAVSLITRLKLDGVIEDFKEEIQKLVDIFKPYAKYHGYLFNDLHILMLFSLQNDEKLIDEYLESFQEYIKNDSNDYLRNVNRELGSQINISILEYNKCNFDSVVENLYPTKSKWSRMGNSNAQKDIFHQILTNAAIKSKKEENHKFAPRLVNERLSLRPDSNINKRLLKKL